VVSIVPLEEVAHQIDKGGIQKAGKLKVPVGKKGSGQRGLGNALRRVGDEKNNSACVNGFLLIGKTRHFVRPSWK